MPESALSRGFPPVVGEDCRVLILGSLPGVRSIEVQQYYAHDRNAFWVIMQQLLGVDATANYADRCAALRTAGVGLWDVLAASARPGSLDAAIDVRTAQPNDFGALLRSRPDIAAIAFNGRKAAELFRRFCDDIVCDSRNYEFLALPSTSPAHAAMSLQDKIRQWSALRRFTA